MTNASKTLLEWAERRNLRGREQAIEAAKLLGITPDYWRKLIRSDNNPKQTLLVAIQQWMRADDLQAENDELKTKIAALEEIITKLIKET